MRHTTHKATGLRIRAPHTTPQTIVIQNDVTPARYGVDCNVEGCVYRKASTLHNLGDAQGIARAHQREKHS